MNDSENLDFTGTGQVPMGTNCSEKKKHVVGLAYENLNKVDPHVWEYPNDV